MEDNVPLDIVSVDDDDNVNSGDQFTEALEAEKAMIVIKEPNLGARVAISMTLVESVHHAAVFASMGSILCSQGIHEPLVKFSKPLAAFSVITNIGYYVLWKRCPLSGYKIAVRPSLRQKFTNQPQLNTVIVRGSDRPRFVQFIHVFASMTAVVMAFWEDISSMVESLQNVFNGAREGVDDNISDAKETSSKVVDKVKETFGRKELDNIQV